MSDPHVDDYCVICQQGPAPGVTMHPVVGVENGCLCESCLGAVTPNDELRELVESWRGTEVQSGNNNAYTPGWLEIATDQLESVIEDD